MADSRLNDGKFYGFNIKKHLRYIPVSYTHLDVYKRQYEYSNGNSNGRR